MKTGDPIVFVVEDDSSMREALTDLIASVGLPVEAFKSAREFLEYKRPDTPACLVLECAPTGSQWARLATRDIPYGSADSHRLRYRPRRYSNVGTSYEGGSSGVSDQAISRGINVLASRSIYRDRQLGN